MFKQIALQREQLSLRDCEESLIKLLFIEALDNGVFDEAHALLGITIQEDSYFTDLVNRFYKATGKKFLDALEGPDYSPDPALSEEEYQNALFEVLEAAQDGVDEAEDWILVGTDGRLT